MIAEGVVLPVDLLSTLNAIPGNHLFILPDAPTFTIVGATDGYLKVTYTDREQILGKPLFAAFPDDNTNKKATSVRNLQAALDLVIRQKQEQKVASQRYDIINPQLGRFEYKVWLPSFKPVLNAEGSIICIIHTAEDITENIRLQEESAEKKEKLEESENRFRRMVEQAPIAILLSRGEDVVIESINEPMLRFMNKTSVKEVLGKKMLEVMPELEGQPALQIVKNVQKTGVPLKVDEQPVDVLIEGQLKRHFFNFSYTPITEAGIVTGVLHVATDITPQVKARKISEESEVRFRSIADQSPMIVFMVEPDAEIRVSYFNTTWLQYTGQNFEEALGRAWDGIVHPDDVQGVFDVYIPAFQNREPYILPALRLRRHDGEYRWHYFKGTPRILPTGEFLGYIGVGIDIHEQKLAEEKLAYRTALLEAHNEASVDGILLVDAKGKIISFNQRFIEIWNMPQEIVDSKDDEAALSFAMTQLVNPQQFIEKVKYLYEHPTEKSFDELAFKDGKIVARHGYSVLGENGTYYAWSWTFRDITDQKTYEKTIVESEERFRLLSNEMPQFVWTGDAEGNLDYFNDSVYRYSGVSKENIAKDGWLQIVHPEDREENIRLWLHSISTGVDFIFEHRFKRADGEYRWQLSRAVAQRDAQGQIRQWIGTSTDIHDKKNLEEQLEGLVAERTKELQRSNEDLQQFAHVASHDLKEPVRKIKTFTGRLERHLDGTLDETGARFIERIHSATNRMFTMIDGVLAYSTTNGDMQTASAVDLNELVGSIETDLEVALRRRDAIIKYNNLPVVEGAAVLLYQLFYNLINNSIKFAKEGVPLQINFHSEIVTDGDQQFAHIVFLDNGIGFEPYDSERIFNSFTRLHSKDKYEGTGLGLSLCRKIVERHGGSIIASGKPDEGATFTITLPVEQKQAGI